MRIPIFSLLSVFFSTTTFALTEAAIIVEGSTIFAHRTHSVTHSTAKARNMYMVFVNGLEEGCTSVYLYADEDPFLFAMVMGAISNPKARTFQFYYATDMEHRGPWGDVKSCMLTSFTERFN